MPNHITSRLTIEGDPNIVAKFFAEIEGKPSDGQPMYIDFNKLRPMPESLNIEAGSRTKKGLALYTQYVNECAAISTMSVANVLSDAETSELLKQLLDRYEKMPDVDLKTFKLGEQCYNNIRDYGCPTWYEWTIENWGTKWNAYQQTKIDENTIEFQTAWSGVPNMVELLAQKYPTLSLSYMYADEDWGCNVGEFEYEGGQCVYSNIPASESDEATAIARELLGEYECDYDEEENEDDMEI